MLEPYLKALIAGDPETCTRILDGQLAAGCSLIEIYDDLMRPALYRVGELWMQNRISVSCEHLATTITEGLINRLYPMVADPRPNGRKVVLATVEDELHRVALRMVADIFETRGWEPVLVSAGATLDELLRQPDAERPDGLGLSFSVACHLDRLQRMLTAIRAAYPELPILLGGQAIGPVRDTDLAIDSGVTLVTSLADLSHVLRTHPAWTSPAQENRA